MNAQEATEPTAPRQPKTFQEAVKLWQRCITKAEELDVRRQEQINRQKETIERLKVEVVRMRELCRQNGVDWQEGL